MPIGTNRTTKMQCGRSLLPDFCNWLAYTPDTDTRTNERRSPNGPKLTQPKAEEAAQWMAFNLCLGNGLACV